MYSFICYVIQWPVLISLSLPLSLSIYLSIYLSLSIYLFISTYLSLSFFLSFAVSLFSHTHTHTDTHTNTYTHTHSLSLSLSLSLVYIAIYLISLIRLCISMSTIISPFPAGLSPVEHTMQFRHRASTQGPHIPAGQHSILQSTLWRTWCERAHGIVCTQLIIFKLKLNRRCLPFLSVIPLNFAKIFGHRHTPFSL